MFNLKGLRYRAILPVVLSFGVAGWGGTRPAQQQQSNGQMPSMSAQELVRRTVDHELKASNDESTHYMFKDRRQTPDGSKTKMMVETKQGTVAYLIAVNDRPLTSAERQQEDQRLQGLLSNPEEQNRKKKAQQADSDRVSRMFRELPNAFIYKYNGLVPGKNGHAWVSLTFEPNPKYDPPSRETSVFRAMSGNMTIDPKVERLAKIEATLFKDVNFGWGILGHLDKGGHFIVEQANIGDSRWEPTYMNIQFTGKALLFKTINLRQIESSSDYTRVPNDLTLAQGVDILKRRADSAVAERSSAR